MDCGKNYVYFEYDELQLLLLIVLRCLEAAWEALELQFREVQCSSSAPLQYMQICLTYQVRRLLALMT